MATQYIDPQRDKWYLAGFVLGDFSIYKKVAQDNKGDLKAILNASQNRQFEGHVNPDGSLTYMGATINWRDVPTP